MLLALPRLSISPLLLALALAPLALALWRLPLHLSLLPFGACLVPLALTLALALEAPRTPTVRRNTPTTPTLIFSPPFSSISLSSIFSFFLFPLSSPLSTLHSPLSPLSTPLSPLNSLLIGGCFLYCAALPAFRNPPLCVFA